MATQRRMGPKLFGWLIIVLVLASPVVFLLMREKTINVTAIKLKKGHVEQTATAIASGTVMASQDAMVSCKAMGTVVRVPHREGEKINEGDVIVELDHAEMDAQVALAVANRKAGNSRETQANIAVTMQSEVSGTQLSQTAAQLNSAKADFDRVKALFDKGAVSKSDFDKVSLALKVAQAGAAAAKASGRETDVRQQDVNMAKANIEQLDAAVKVAEAARDNAILKAPFPGVIAKILRDEGEAVSPGMPVLQLVNSSDLYVEAPFDEANAAEITIGQKARVDLDAYRGTDFIGKVEFISPVVTINPDLSRTLNIRVRVKDGAEKFLPGMSADVVILIKEKDDTLFAPTEALVRGEYAFVVENGRAHKRPVKTGVGNWNTVEVLEGLKDGEHLITSISLAELTDGVKVNVVDSLDTK